MRNPICIIPNGVDLPELVESSALEVESPPFQKFAQGRKVLLYLGRLHPKKNVANLVRAWKQTLDSDAPISNSWVLAIAGWDQGGYERTLKQLANDLGLSFADVGNHRSKVSVQQSTASSLAFLGPQFGAEKDACYRMCDAFILPSLSEGLPMAVLEAWAYGKPVLMTPECNLPGGFATDAAVKIDTTVNRIEEGLVKLIEMTDSDCAAMGQRGRALRAEQSSWRRV